MLDKNHILIIAKFSNVFFAKIPSPPRMTALLEQLLVSKLVKKFYAPCEIQMYIAKFTTHEPDYSQINQVQALPSYELLFHGCLPTTPPLCTLCCSVIHTITRQKQQ
jgi:hypothetical protein